ncbi:MAG: citrate lyase subunit alpha [Pseudomonadota bacterium]
MTKRVTSLAAAIERAGLRDGGTVSFHHHLRNGDGVLNMVMDALEAAGLRALRLAPSSLFPVHAPLSRHIANGTVSAIETAFLAGPVGQSVMAAGLAEPLRLTTHGGRAAAIRDGHLRIDAAFIAAPAADEVGNIAGTLGPNACGTLGYPMVDVRHAAHVVAVTDHLVPYPCVPPAIGAEDVDTVVVVDSIGDARGILSGTTRPATDPADRAIAAQAAALIAVSGRLVDGFSFQTGAGAISLAAAGAVAEAMAARDVTGSFAAGGITGAHVGMLEARLFRALLDVQCFDLEAAASHARNPCHRAISAAAYAAPGPRGAVVDRLDAVILGAAEIDRDFNVNVTLGTDRRLIGGSGGHADTAAGAGLAIVTTRLVARGFAKFVDRVACITTPGATIDAVVSEAGIAINPARPELAERARAAGLPLVGIDDLIARAGAAATVVSEATRASDTTVALSLARTGEILDRIRAPRHAPRGAPSSTSA